MSKKQKIVLWTGIVVTVLMLVFPPIRETSSARTSRSEPTFYPTTRYRLLLTRSIKDVQYLQLCLQCVVVWSIAAVFLTTFKACPKQTHKEKEFSVEQPIDRIIQEKLRGK